MGEEKRIRLAGVAERNPRAGDPWLIAEAAERLPKIVEGAEPTRMLGYESNQTRFMGLEVKGLAAVPPGMVAWELSETARTVIGPGGGARRETIAWTWLARPAAGPGEWIGEFRTEAGEAYRLFAACPVDPEHPQAEDAVALVDPDPAWPRAFGTMATHVRESLGPELALRIEHYGSTAIPGLPAKPVIDMLVEVPSPAAAREGAIPALAGPAWEYWVYMDHLVFIRRARPGGPRTHHVHMAPRGHRAWEGLAFRDHLRAHPEDAARYAALKSRLAALHEGDREAYTEAKAAFVQEIVTRARPTA